MVRESVHKPDSYALSVNTGEQVSQILIHRRPDNKFDVGGGHQFETLKDLVDFYTATPMVEKNGGLVCLKQVRITFYFLFGANLAPLVPMLALNSHRIVYSICTQN